MIELTMEDVEAIVNALEDNYIRVPEHIWDLIVRLEATVVDKDAYKKLREEY